MTDRLPRINVIRDLPPPVLAPKPVTRQLGPPVINIPSYEAPTYDAPIIQAPLQPPVGGANQGNEGNPPPPATARPGLGMPPPKPIPEAPPELGTTIEIGGLEVPVPKGKDVALAGTTAIASVTAALLAKSVVETLIKVFKPIVKMAILKVKKAMGKQLTEEEVQLYFALGQDQKALTKVLAKTQAKQVLEQKLQQRQRK